MRKPDTERSCPRDDRSLLDALVEIQKSVAAVELDAAVVQQLIIDGACAIAGASGAAIEMLDGAVLVPHRAAGLMDRGGDPAPAVPFGPARRCAQTGETVYCADVAESADLPSADRDVLLGRGIRSAAWTPIAPGGQLAGVLSIGSTRADGFDERGLAGLQLIAGLLAASIGHAAQFEARRVLLAERAAASASLRETEERFRGAFESAAIGMALVGLDGQWIRVNRSLCQMLGYAESELLGTTFQALTHPDDLDADLAHVGRMIAGEIPSYRMTKRYVDKAGRIVWAQLGVSLVRDVAGTPLYFVSQLQDVTEQRRKEAFDADQRAVLERVAQDRPLHEVLGGLTEMVERQLPGAWASVLLLHDGEIQLLGPSLPPSFARALEPRALTLAAALGRGHGPQSRLPAVSDVGRDPIWGGLRSAAAGHGVMQTWAVPIRSGDDDALGLLAVYCGHGRPPTFADGEMLDAAARLATLAIEHFQTTRRLAHLVRHDVLTGLPNRVCFDDRLQQAMASARRSGRRVGVGVLDIDRFKQVNDELGHEAGDALLQQFAGRLRAELRETDTLARMGGDEFTIVLPELSGIDGAVAVAEKLIASLVGPFLIAGRSLAVTCSMGIAIYPDDGDDSAVLQRRADERMYETKRRGRNGYTIEAGAEQAVAG